MHLFDRQTTALVVIQGFPTDESVVTLELVWKFHACRCLPIRVHPKKICSNHTYWRDSSDCFNKGLQSLTQTVGWRYEMINESESLVELTNGAGMVGCKDGNSTES
jgi:hypothetical protein